MKKHVLIAGLAGLALVGAAAVARADEKKQSPPRVVPSVDLGRSAGVWYEIARFPNKFQKSCAGDVTATYTVRESGGLDVLNQCRERDGDVKKAKGRARLADKDGPNSKLEVRFAPSWTGWLPFVWGDYWVLDLAPDYSYSVVGSPDRDYLWVLARTPMLDGATYEKAVRAAAAQGFDTSRLVKTKHS